MSAPLSEEELFDAIDGLMAYDMGCASSGISDPILRERVGKQLLALARDGKTSTQRYSKKFSETIARLLWSFSLSPEAIGNGYGFDDLLAEAAWIETFVEDAHRREKASK